MLTTPHLAVTRVRHPLKIRLLQVVRVHKLSQYLVRVTLAGEALHDFESASFDDHVKVFFPAPGAEHPVLPVLGPDGPVLTAELPRPIARDFTPRRYDRAACELDLEFALHGDTGPAAAWAAQARVGQYLGIGGPRGSLVIPTGFEWHLLIGDDTALPAIARRLAELPAGTRVATVIEVADAAGRIALNTAADLFEVWRYRNEADPRPARAADLTATPYSPLLQAVRETYLPPGDGYVWAAGEASAMRAIRQYLCEERGVNKARIRAASYWRRGAAAVHENLDD